MENQNDQAPVMRFGEWFVTILIASIPIIGQVMLFVWAFGGGNNPNKSNWAKAVLVWAAIAIVLYVFLFVLIFGAMMSGAK